LHAALSEAGLSSYEAAADAWCREVGAAFLEELAGEEELEAFCAALSLSSSGAVSGNGNGGGGGGGRSLASSSRQRLRAAILAGRDKVQEHSISSTLSKSPNAQQNFPSVRSW
jgi:hypothetical protein